MSMHRTIAVYLVLAAAAWAQPRTVDVTVHFDRHLGPMEMGRFALGQGGLSEEPIFAERIPELRVLRPRVIRLFLQQYFDPLPAPGRYRWTTLDASVDMIRKTGAEPLMAIAFKPKALFPRIDQNVVEPASYPEWERLIVAMVRHYKQRGSGIRYWEVANEPDIGEDGGCPYKFTPENYARYYAHTVRAILRADPKARVGGPALANSASPILPALLDFCERENVPIHFVSWHIYSSDPLAIRRTIERTRGLLARHPSLKLETFLDEWNMSLGDPPLDRRFQPCFVAEVAWQMRDAGLDYACYYHIRDYHVRPETFAQFMSPAGVALMTKWWNQMSQFDGLFDFQNQVRPAYYTFRLLARLTGERLALESADAGVHGFATYDDALRRYNVMIWNYAKSPARAAIQFEDLPGNFSGKRLILDALAPGQDENVRLRPAGSLQLAPGSHRLDVELEPYGVTFLFFDREP